ncbi:MAG: rRNA methyltransferase [Gammaproteobacteria bacterium SG8_47]|nr:MAG: rRNA methyltransferase [Gammaproteobacteria bacterium SG8_47]
MNKSSPEQPRARKRFGQHFLHDPGTIQRIVASIQPRPGECMLEIGPGPGALTQALLPAVGTLDVVELDRDLIPMLKRACTGIGTLNVHVHDALTFDLCGLRVQRCPDSRLRVVGNLPYNISTPLLFHLLAQLPCIEDMHFMLQKEVVDRLAAEPGTKDYGRLSVMIQFYCEVEMLFVVGPGVFRPPPRVDSAVVRLRPRRVPPVAIDDPAALAVVVKQAFSQRRKTLRNALQPLLSAADIARAGVDPGLRAERLGLADFARLTNAFCSRRST